MNIFKGKTKPVRVRFAPSPTGPLHVGGVRTALFNYLFAKKNNGDFVLRIEDTDEERSELKWVQEIIEGLGWLGLSWDEGPDIDGKFGPYKQSQRLDIYEKYLKKLLGDEKAYYCFCKKEELEAKRQEQMSRGQAPKYDGKCRNLSKETVDSYFKEGRDHVVRFKVQGKKVAFHDAIRGQVEFDAGLLGDVVIAKDLRHPLYHFAVVVDDFEMKISHVIRGEDHISNTPRQLLLQEALGFQTPIYAHIPLLLGQDRSKLSKRNADVALEEYRREGYLKEAIVNFVAFLGWNPGTEQEIFSLKELVKEFSLEKVQKGGAVFNFQRLDFINSFYIKEKPIEALTKLCLPYLKEAHLIDEECKTPSGKKFSKKALEAIINLHKTRMKKLSEVVSLTDFFFKDKLDYKKNLLKWKQMSDNDVKEALTFAEKSFTGVTKWNKKTLEEILLKEAEKFNKEKGYPEKDRGYLLWPTRVALSGKKASASPFEIAEILGKETTIKRIQDAIA